EAAQVEDPFLVLVAARALARELERRRQRAERARVDEAPHALLLGRAQHVARAADVHPVEALGVGLPEAVDRRRVDQPLGARGRAADALAVLEPGRTRPDVEPFEIAQVEIRADARDHLVSARAQRAHDARADEAVATGHEAARHGVDRPPLEADQSRRSRVAHAPRNGHARRVIANTSGTGPALRVGEDVRRTRWLRALLARPAAWLLRALAWTWRVEIRGDDPFAPGAARPVLAALWHESALCAAGLYRDLGVHVAVSRS